MVHILCISPDQSHETPLGGLMNKLTESWRSFASVNWMPYKSFMGQDVDLAGYTHLLVVDTLEHLEDIAAVLPDSQNLMTYAWAMIETPFIDTRFADLASKFDFFVTMSGMAAEAYRGVLAEPGGMNKGRFKSAFQLRTIMPGVDTTTYAPLSPFSRDFGHEELRLQFFGDAIDDNAYLVTVLGDQDLPTAMATVKRLDDMIDRDVKTYFHMEQTDELLALASGNDLSPGTNFFAASPGYPPAPAVVNLIYNCSDLVLCTETRAAWPFTTHQAMSAGALVAAPDEHVWLELIVDGRGIELPTRLFEKDGDDYVRRLSPDSSAASIAERLTRGEHLHLREDGTQWARTKTPELCAEQWMRLFGLTNG